MSLIQNILAVIVVLGVLVTFHEFGHFWVARRCGVKVLRFSVGFGKPFWSRIDRHGTEFAVAAIPLGGYVKMLDEREAPVPADEVEIRNALNTAVIGGVDLVVSVGGVGVGARDVAPEATEPLLDRRLRGIEEAIRSSGLAAGATDGGISRGLAGISGQTLVVNIARSRAAVRDGMATVAPLAKYVIESISEF